jgi:hypothetical protein
MGGRHRIGHKMVLRESTHIRNPYRFFRAATLNRNRVERLFSAQFLKASARCRVASPSFSDLRWVASALPTFRASELLMAATVLPAVFLGVAGFSASNASQEASFAEMMRGISYLMISLGFAHS